MLEVVVCQCQNSHFQALVVWLKNDLENRSKDMSRLLGLVKLPLLSPQVRMITSNIFCRLLILVKKSTLLFKEIHSIVHLSLF